MGLPPSLAVAGLNGVCPVDGTDDRESRRTMPGHGIHRRMTAYTGSLPG